MKEHKRAIVFDKDGDSAEKKVIKRLKGYTGEKESLAVLIFTRHDDLPIALAGYNSYERLFVAYDGDLYTHFKIAYGEESWKNIFSKVFSMWCDGYTVGLAIY